METEQRERVGEGVPLETSALDRPLNGTYIRIVVLEAAIIGLLWVVGRLYL